MSMHQQILSGLKWTAGARLGGQIITWGITIFVMRLLAPEDYGLQAMASVFLAFLLMLVEMGLGSALIQKQEVSQTTLRQAFGFVLTVNLVLLLALNLLAPLIAVFFNDQRLVPILRVLSLQFPIIALGVIPNVLLQRKLGFRSQSLIDLSAAVSSSVLILLLAFAHYGVWALVLGNLFAGLWRTVALNLVEPFACRPIFSWHGMRALLSFGGNLSLTRLLWFFYTQVDVLIVGKLLGKEMLGLYSVAMHLASLPVQRVSGVLNQVAFPVLSRFQNDREQLSGYVLKAARALSFFAFPVLWGISSTANEIVLLFLGPGWKGAIVPLQLLALMMPLRMLANFLPSATDAIGRPEIGLQNVLLASLVMPIAFWFASRWGIVGMAVAWVTVYPVLLIINIRRMLGAVRLRLRDLFQAIAPALLSAAGMYATVWLVRWQLGGATMGAGSLLLMMVLGALAYAGLSLFLNKNGCQEVVRLVRQN